jgi:kynurenine 3-monooxygenase
LDELEKFPNVRIFFAHKLTGADFNRKVAWFEQRPSAAASGAGSGRAREIEVPFDFMIGADGAHSAVRYHMMKFARVDYEQKYIDTLWCEFQIPPLPAASDRGHNAGGRFRLSPNHLHIWPGDDSMFIAIPSLVRTLLLRLYFCASVLEKHRVDENARLAGRFFHLHSVHAR